MYDERISLMMDKIKEELPDEYDWFKKTNNLSRLMSHIGNRLK